MLFEKFHDAGADGYERAFGRVSSDIVPTLVRAAHLSPGQRVLDVATGTGIVAAAALDVIGPSGHLTATDLSGPMLDQARRRLEKMENVDFALMNGQALTFPDEDFDVVLCGMALMFFPDASPGVVAILPRLAARRVGRGFSKYSARALVRIAHQRCHWQACAVACGRGREILFPG